MSMKNTTVGQKTGKGSAVAETMAADRGNKALGATMNGSGAREAIAFFHPSRKKGGITTGHKGNDPRVA